MVASPNELSAKLADVDEAVDALASEAPGVEADDEIAVGVVASGAGVRRASAVGPMRYSEPVTATAFEWRAGEPELLENPPGGA